MLLRSLALVFTVLCGTAATAEPEAVGWVEYARIYPGKMLFMAKLDTGSYSSHINARNIEEFEKDGKPWVRFEVVNRLKRSMTLELKQARDVTVKLEEGQTEKRPSVWLGICVSGVYKKTLVSLDNRENLLYPLLIGRKYLKEKFAIDPSMKLRTRPKCTVPENG